MTIGLIRRGEIIMKYVINGKYIEMYFEKIPDEKLRESFKICGWK